MIRFNKKLQAKIVFFLIGVTIDKKNCQPTPHENPGHRAAHEKPQTPSPHEAAWCPGIQRYRLPDG